MSYNRRRWLHTCSDNHYPWEMRERWSTHKATQKGQKKQKTKKKERLLSREGVWCSNINSWLEILIRPPFGSYRWDCRVALSSTFPLPFGACEPFLSLTEKNKNERLRSIELVCDASVVVYTKCCVTKISEPTCSGDDGEEERNAGWVASLRSQPAPFEHSQINSDAWATKFPT